MMTTFLLNGWRGSARRGKVIESFCLKRVGEGEKGGRRGHLSENFPFL